MSWTAGSGANSGLSVTPAAPRTNLHADGAPGADATQRESPYFVNMLFEKQEAGLRDCATTKG